MDGEEVITIAIETRLSDDKKFELILDLKNNPSLWNTGSLEYKSRPARAKSSETLSEKYNIDCKHFEIDTSWTTDKPDKGNEERTGRSEVELEIL